jgi:hypothetical protein
LSSTFPLAHAPFLVLAVRTQIGPASTTRTNSASLGAKRSKATHTTLLFLGMIWANEAVVVAAVLKLTTFANGTFDVSNRGLGLPSANHTRIVIFYFCGAGFTQLGITTLGYTFG